MKYLSITLVLCALHLKYAQAAKKVIPIAIKPCEGVEKSVFLEYNRAKNIWNGNLTTLFEVDSSQEFQAEVRLWKNGGWEKKAQTFKGKICFYVKKFGGELWKDIKAATKPPLSDCPIPIDTYRVENFKPTTSTAFIPILSTDKWQGKLKSTKNGKVFCAMIETDFAK